MRQPLPSNHRSRNHPSLTDTLVVSNRRKRLGGRHNPNHVLVPGHSLVAGYGCYIKFLRSGADTTQASVRTTVDDACRAQIAARLATRPNPEAVAVCRICKGLARKTPLQVRRRLRYMRLPEERPEEIVWHLRCWCVFCVNLRRIGGV